MFPVGGEEKAYDVETVYGRGYFQSSREFCVFIR